MEEDLRESFVSDLGYNSRKMVAEYLCVVLRGTLCSTKG